MCEINLAAILNVVKERRSVRAYDGRPVEREVLERLCEAGLWAPSPSNVQSLRFVVIDGTDETLDLLKTVGPGFPREATAAIVICSDQSSVTMFSGPVCGILCAEEAAAAAENICLAATSAGLGSCFVASFVASGVGRLLDLPAEVKPILIVALGYPDPNRVATAPERRKLEEVVSWNAWGKKK